MTLAERITVLNERLRYAWATDKPLVEAELRDTCKQLINGAIWADAGIRLDTASSTRRRLVFTTSYKHAIGRTHHTVIACRNGAKLVVTAFGRNRNNVNSIIAELLQINLLKEI